MKKIYAILFIVFLLPPYIKAQSKRMISIQLSYHQVVVGVEHKILNEKLFAELFAGIANQDINSRYDDFTSRLGLGFIAFSNSKNQISIHVGSGIYLSSNNYYSVTIPLLDAGTRYTRLIGKTGKHGLFINAGYRYGKRDYKQQYSSDILSVSNIGKLKLKPVYFSIGYGFKF